MRRFAFCLVFCAVRLGLGALPVFAADTDVGNIAVLETDPTILQPGEPFDLNAMTLTFTPRPGGGYTVGVGAVSFDPGLGGSLGLGNDASAFQPFGFTFPFFGATYSGVFVNSNGNLTFGGASTLNHFNAGGGVGSLGSDLSAILDRVSSGLPRIAPVWQDWNPAGGGGVLANALPDRLVVTWNAVPLNGTSTTATFQVILFSSGVIRMNYQSVPVTPAGGYLTGISPGSVNEFVVTTIDFSQGPASSISTFPDFEPLVQVFGASTTPLVHVPAVSRRFFKAHSDAFDQLVMFANFANAMGGAFAFELTVQQAVQGIGLDTYDLSSFYGSQGRFQSFLNMNRLSVYPADPTTKFLGTNSTLDVMGQEGGHQWLAFLSFDDGGVCSTQLLGRALAHWSFFHDTDASDMEGNKWQDNGGGTFTTIDATRRYSALDRYAMGLRAPGNVPDFFFINHPTGTTKTASSAPQIGVTVSGTRQNVSVNQMVACEGTRVPSSGFSAVNPTTTWRQAFVLLIKGGTAAPQSDLSQMATIREAWGPYFSSATGGLGAVDSTLNQNVPDLVVTAVSNPPASAPIGGTFPVTDTVRNQGSAAAGASTTRYYLSLDQLKGSTDRLLTGTRAVPALAAGAESTGTINVTVPSTTPLGTYFLLACADDTRTVIESNETNNCKASVGSVTVTP